MDFSNDEHDSLYSDGDDENSPEYLTPVKDPYSSDYETEKKRRKFVNPTRAYEDINNSQKTLMDVYNVRYCPKPKMVLNSQEMVNVDITTIIEHLIYFMTCRMDLSGNELMQRVEEYRIRNDHIKHYSNDKKYAINLKDCVDCPYALSEENTFRDDLGTIEGQIVDFISSLMDVLTNSDKNRSSYQASQFSDSRMCMFRFCTLIGEPIIQDGTAECSLRPTKPGMCTVVTQPHLVITGAIKSCPGIPIEVYNNKEATCKETTNHINHVKTTQKSKSTEELLQKQDLKDDVLNFIYENTPACPHSMEQDFKMEHDLKNMLSTKHVLQIIAVAAHCIFKKCFKSRLDRYRTRAFIGLYVVNEYVYVTKLVTQELNLAKLGMLFELPEDPSQKLLLIKKETDSAIHVQFLPTVFDLSIHKHRTALLLFLKYYKCHWDEIIVDPIVVM